MNCETVNITQCQHYIRRQRLYTYLFPSSFHFISGTWQIFCVIGSVPFCCKFENKMHATRIFIRLIWFQWHACGKENVALHPPPWHIVHNIKSVTKRVVIYSGRAFFILSVSLFLCLCYRIISISLSIYKL